MTDDHVLGWYLTCTCDELLPVCSTDLLWHAYLLLLVLGIAIHDKLR